MGGENSVVKGFFCDFMKHCKCSNCSEELSVIELINKKKTKNKKILIKTIKKVGHDPYLVSEVD